MTVSDVTYRQCELHRPRTGETDIAWIPASFAKRGKWLRIGEDPVTWQVTEVYAGTTLTAEQMLRLREELKRFQYVLGD